MTKSGFRRAARAAWRSLRVAAASLLAIALAAGLSLALGAFPVGGDAGDGPDGVAIHVVSNGFHTDIVLPMREEARDWRPLLDASPITAPWREAPFVAFGWGSQAAYTELGTLLDLSPGLLVRAAAFDASVVHVQPVVAITAVHSVRRLVVSRGGYRALVAHVERSLSRDDAGAPVVLAGLTHGSGDAFFRGRDRFWLLRSCNVWVAEALRAAGRPVGLWTPLAQTLVWSLGPGAARSVSQDAISTPLAMDMTAVPPHLWRGSRGEPAIHP